MRAFFWKKLYNALVKSNYIFKSTFVNPFLLIPKLLFYSIFQTACPVNGRKCPTCNVKAHWRDIRVLYAKTLIALDTTEKDRLMDQLRSVRSLPKHEKGISSEYLLYSLYFCRWKKKKIDLNLYGNNLNQKFTCCKSKLKLWKMISKN